MSARRRAKAGAVIQGGDHRPGVECPWGPDPVQPQCPHCTVEFGVHVAWLLTSGSRPWSDFPAHRPSHCFECRRDA